ncbi:uracil-DNA glycosylase [Flavobacteriaceae bacterium UJ101]|nr:uracil-DNA glycosylase [Flavobacteriaceae bacterium UJ101]
MEVKIAENWKKLLHTEFEKPYFHSLVQFVKREYHQNTCFPPGKEIFAAFDSCQLEDLKVVILGQDPYHNHNQANGLCFSVREGIPFPPSLQNIFKEVTDDMGSSIPSSGDLTRWANQGVLLLNATLTVRAHQAGSHQNQGWEVFTDSVIETISKEKKDVVFILWGSFAQKKAKLIDAQKHHILKAPHPSPLSSYRGFFGSKHFSKTNAFLKSKGKKEIVW